MQNKFTSLSLSLTEQLDVQRANLHNVVPVSRIVQDLLDALSKEDKAFLQENRNVIFVWKSIWDANWTVQVVSDCQAQEIQEKITKYIPNNIVIRFEDYFKKD